MDFGGKEETTEIVLFLVEDKNRLLEIGNIKSVTRSEMQ